MLRPAPFTLIWFLCAAVGSNASAAGTSTFVLDLDSDVVAAEQLATLSEELRQQLSQFDQLAVMSNSDIIAMLDIEQQKQMAGCDSSSCLTELAGALNAEQIVTGRVGVIGDRKIIQLQLVDARQAKALRRISHAVDGNDLVDAVRAAARKLMQVGATIHLINQVDGAEVFVAEQPVGAMPLKPFTVPESGDVSLRVEHVDYLPYDATVTLVPGKLTRHVLRVHKYSDLEDAASSREYTAYATMGVGLLSVGLGSVFYAQAARSHRDYDDLDPRVDSQARFDDLETRAKERLLYAAVSAGLGGALVGTGLYLLLVNPHRALLDEYAVTSVAVGFAPAPDGWRAAATLRF